jgi:hypothetical protein
MSQMEPDLPGLKLRDDGHLLRGSRRAFHEQPLLAAADAEFRSKLPGTTYRRREGFSAVARKGEPNLWAGVHRREKFPRARTDFVIEIQVRKPGL